MDMFTRQTREVGITNKMACTEAQRNEESLVYLENIISMSCFGGVAGVKVYGVVRGQVTNDSVCHTKELLFLSCRQFNRNLIREMT